MKLGIITQPLLSNYGGILQNYALQQILIQLGHEVYTINRNKRYGIWYTIKQLLKRLIGRPAYPLYRETLIINQHCRRFVDDYIRKIDLYGNQEEWDGIVNKYKFEGYVVGSDQVWRPCYFRNIYNAFLDFCQGEKNIKRMAYAASFGVSDWEFSEEQTEGCRCLVKLFDAISVREDSAVKLCKGHLGVDAIHLLDPTLLLEKEDYIKLIEEKGELESAGELFCYILDNNNDIKKVIQDIGIKLSLKTFEIKAKKDDYLHKKGEDINDYIKPSPTMWLRAFMDAKMVFTDSFHGCVFSIIFNKPFWVIGNKERGNARFDSLLKLFNLEKRRIDINDINNIELSMSIDWTKVNLIKRTWQKKSTEFLIKNLKS